MSSFDPPSNFPYSSSSSSSSQPWVWVLIPVGIVLVIGGAAFFLHSRRRKQIPLLLPTTAPSSLPTLNHPPRAHTRSRAFNERELTGSIQNGRWYWAHTVPAAPQPEEGLNELGEAPPPYEKQLAPSTLPPLSLDADGDGAGPAPKSNTQSSAFSLHDDEPVELHTLATTVTMTTTSRRSSSSSFGDGTRAGGSRDPLSPFTISTAPSTALSSSSDLVHGTPAAPPAYEAPAPARGMGAGD